MGCFTWSNEDDDWFRGLCTNKLKAETDSEENPISDCRLCVNPYPVGGGECDACPIPPTNLMEINISVVDYHASIGAVECCSEYNGTFILRRTESCKWVSDEQAIRLRIVPNPSPPPYTPVLSCIYGGYTSRPRIELQAFEYFESGYPRTRWIISVYWYAEGDFGVWGWDGIRGIGTIGEHNCTKPVDFLPYSGVSQGHHTLGPFFYWILSPCSFTYVGLATRGSGVSGNFYPY